MNLAALRQLVETDMEPVVERRAGDELFVVLAGRTAYYSAHYYQVDGKWSADVDERGETVEEATRWLAVSRWLPPMAVELTQSR